MGWICSYSLRDALQDDDKEMLVEGVQILCREVGWGGVGWICSYSLRDALQDEDKETLVEGVQNLCREVGWGGVGWSEVG